MAPLVNILLCSIGRRVELARLFKQAYQRTGIKGKIVGFDINPTAPALWEVDKPYIVPRLNTPEYLPALIDICRKEQINLILPLIDYDIPVLAQNKTAIEETNATVCVIPEEMVSVVNDKWATYQFFTQLGVKTPKSWLPETLNNETLSYPLFIKPRQGSASQHTFKVNNQRELEFFIDYGPDPIIQEFIPGAEITNDVMCDFTGVMQTFVSRQRVEVRSGEVNKGVTIFNEGICRDSSKIAAALQAVGPITVQCMQKDNTPYFTEINARLGGGVPLGVAAGVHSLDRLLQIAAKQPIPPSQFGSYQTDLYLSRFDDSRFLTPNDRSQMAQNRYKN